MTVTVGGLDAGFYVTDDGPGVPADHRATGFEAGHTTTRHGSGLGLTIVEQVCVDHGWDRRLTEGANGGARFEVTGVEDGGG